MPCCRAPRAEEIADPRRRIERVEGRLELTEEA